MAYKNGTIMLAKESEKEEILALYRSMLYGAADWDDHYPSEETIDFDLSRDALFVMKNELGEIIGTISIDEDEEVAALDCWSKDWLPNAELSRLCVRGDMHNQGIARQLMGYVMDLLKERGCEAVHILIREGHEVAFASYKVFGYVEVGKAQLFEKDFVCLERKL